MNGLSKQKQKYIQSLHNKKYRKQLGLFLVEGEKSILELLRSDFHVEELFLTQRAIGVVPQDIPYELSKEEDIDKVSTLKSNNFGIAVVRVRENAAPDIIGQSWTLALDDISDPGNLGTIIRIADWYGINSIICSENTVDFYNPKVISSTMGSFTRVSCIYTDLALFFSETKLPVYGAVLQGENLHGIGDLDKGIMLIGSESHGISKQLLPFLKRRITIPSFGKAESLNAAVATGILLDNLKRLS